MGLYNELAYFLAEIRDLKEMLNLLIWDQSTYLPSEASHGLRMATLGQLIQIRLADPKLGQLINQCQDLSSLEAAHCEIARQDHQRACRIPPALVAKALEHQSRTHEAWVAARTHNDFSIVAPLLQENIKLSRQWAACFPEMDHPLDALMEENDSGMRVAILEPLFHKLKIYLQKLLPQVLKKQERKTIPHLSGRFPKDKQLALAKHLAQELGFDFRRGRLDESPHPFMITLGLNDVRITTRVDENDFQNCFFSTAHEVGHALYEQGFDTKLYRTLLFDGISSGVHESQSRLWENIVCRNLAFWHYFYPHIQKVFPEVLTSVCLEDFVNGINKVKPSFIRTEADEVTYNLHVIIRFELEKKFLEGRLLACDLPKAWDDAYEELLGIRPPHDNLGCLQDIHWYSGLVGGQFQGYALGNILSAQFYHAFLKAEPNWEQDLAQKGSFHTLRNWLGHHLHQYGRQGSPQSYIEKITGKALGLEDYLTYLENKFGAQAPL